MKNERLLRLLREMENHLDKLPDHFAGEIRFNITNAPIGVPQILKAKALVDMDEVKGGD